MINLVIFASGSGSNAQRIAEYFSDHSKIKIAAIYCNNAKAFVIDRARNLQIPLRLFSREDLQNGSVLKHLQEDGADYVILAGFLWLIPADLIRAYDNRIINIHPALLPNYGGKGMYGHFVHQSVISNKEVESGITIHLVNEEYDNGRHLLQAKVSIDTHDTPATLAEKIHNLEHEHFPKVIEEYVLGDDSRRS